MITPYAPFPPNSGGRIRMWEQITYLGKRHQLTVVAFVSSSEEYELGRILKSRCYQVIMVNQKLSTPIESKYQQKLPYILRKYDSVEMWKTLAEQRGQDFDIVLIEHIYMAHYQQLFPGQCILEEQNIESEIFKQQALLGASQQQVFPQSRARSLNKATWLHMVLHENQTWPKFPLRITVSEKDKQEIEQRCNTGRTVVIENGVNLNTFTPVTPIHSRKILFMGTLEYHPNIDGLYYALNHIFPRIWRSDPSISIVIAGRNPPQAVFNLAASNPRIELFATPADIREVAKLCSLTIVPLRIGGGTRIKILHSMALGLPVVTTGLGCQGLRVRDNHHLLIRDTPEQFATAVRQLCSDETLRNSLIRNGRKLVTEQYNWQTNFEKMEQELLEFTQKGD
ncbi:glycosyltransferase family 4 protein [candidate division CSSED10-310 bacterium]|uniref:Glycosyltransferase family 4 protein n=1 Tax=candidate division CSSED10-310 bacterium TaxID=2855610 RepID=A0ABV6YUU2_UNCC1